MLNFRRPEVYSASANRRCQAIAGYLGQGKLRFYVIFELVPVCPLGTYVADNTKHNRVVLTKSHALH